MIQDKFRWQKKRMKHVFWFMVLGLSFIAVIGCKGGGDEGGLFWPQTVTVEAGDATLTCANETDMVACRGIRYAQALRFAPADNVALDGEINATEFGSACIQDDGTGSEDCLFLNVFFPRGTRPGDDLPVMFWIHGGAYIQGAGSVPGYDVPALVKEGVIVVTINYRLNAFGFLPHPALEDPTGNFGLKDQVKALQWVQEYISDFGGNPDNVTIFGESAGGHSVLSLLVSEVRDDGLFQKAIVQSGSYSPTQLPLTSGDVNNGYFYYGYPFANVGGVPSVGPCGGSDDPATIRACLRGLTVEQIMATQAAAPAWAWFTPVYYAGTFLPQSISTALAAGGTAVADVPVMIGSNLHEGTLFAALFMGDFGNLADQTNYRAAVAQLLISDPRAYDRTKTADDYVTRAVNLYGDNANVYRNAYSMIWTDSVFACNKMAQSTMLAQRAGQYTYDYWFADENAPINPTYAALALLSSLFNFGDWGVGAAHSFEIQYVFGHVQEHPDVTPAQRNLSNRIITYWTNFAKNGDPGAGWTAYNGANMRRLHPSGDSDVLYTDFAATHHCGAWADPGTPWPLDPP